jgi:hypothetical protein
MTVSINPKPEAQNDEAAALEAHPSSIEPVEVLQPVQPVAGIMDVLEQNSELETINDNLGTAIGNLAYNEYRQLVGILEQLREEDEEEKNGKMKPRFGAAPEHVPPSLVFPAPLEANEKTRAQTKMQKLITFIENSPDEELRNLKPILEARWKFHDPEAMKQLTLLTRLYYLRGVNIANPENNPEKPTSLKIADDEEISLRIENNRTPIITFLKTGETISVRYSDLGNKTKLLQLQPGKVYIFGRIGESPFTVKNCEKNIHTTLNEQGGLPVKGIIQDGRVSRAGIGVEIKDGGIIIYDRASRNTLILNSTKLQTGESMVFYRSVNLHEAETVVLGSSVLHESLHPGQTAIIAEDKMKAKK